MFYEKIVQSYNNTPHRSLSNLAPNDVNEHNEADVWSTQYLNGSYQEREKPSRTESLVKLEVRKKKAKRRKRQYKFKIGSLVRISHTKHIFDRS